MFSQISDWDKSTESTRIFLENLAISAQLRNAILKCSQSISILDDHVSLEALEVVFDCCLEASANA